MHDVGYDDVNMCIFCIFEFHLIFDFILSEGTDSFKPELIDTGFSYMQSILLVMLFLLFSLLVFK